MDPSPCRRSAGLPQSCYWTVGSRLRATVSPTCSRQAVIATLEPDHAVVLWQDDYNYDYDYSHIYGDAPFVVAPCIRTKITTSTTTGGEATLPLQSLSELLEFEQPIIRATATNNKQEQHESAFCWKERGDALLRLHDYSAAVVWYEKALRATSLSSAPASPRTATVVPSIGATVLVKTSAGRVVAAEVDCVDESTVDVTLVETGQEISMSQDKVLLVVQQPLHQQQLDPEVDDLQERILLNLSRCLLQLADHTTGPSTRRPLYLKSTVLGCTLVLALLDLRRDRGQSSTKCDSDATTSTDSSSRNNNNNTTISTATDRTKSALLLRSRAQTGLQKFTHARADGQRLQRIDPVQGQRELQRLERQKAKLVQTNQRLARNVSQWVQSVLQNNDEINDEDDDDDNNPDETTTQP